MERANPMLSALISLEDRLISVSDKPVAVAVLCMNENSQQLSKQNLWEVALTTGSLIS